MPGAPSRKMGRCLTTGIRLKGLLYFTDGYGIYPGQMPDYDTAFIFLNEDYDAPDVPPWAIRIVLDNDERQFT